MSLTYSSKRRDVQLTEKLRKLPMHLITQIGKARQTATPGCPKRHVARDFIHKHPVIFGQVRRSDIDAEYAKKRTHGQTEEYRRSVNTGLNGEKLPPATRLRALKVGQKTLNRYLTCIKEFEGCRGQGRKVTDAQLDRHVTAYITHLYGHDFDLSAATYTIYGLQLLRCNVAKEAFLVGA
jgi:hypothetical protein